jgi:hypothetical protein
MTSTWPHDAHGNAPLYASPADWISPLDDGRDLYEHDPPAGRAHGKVVVTDTDHLWGVGGTPAWVWKSFLRGLNPIFMDPYQTAIHDLLPTWTPADSARGGPAPAVAPEWEDVRAAMGIARAVAARADLAALRPAGELASSRYCLAAPGREYLVYRPGGRGRLHRLSERLVGRFADGPVTVDLSSARGELAVEWVDARRALLFAGPSVRGGRRLALRPPFAGDAVLHLRAAPDVSSGDARSFPARGGMLVCARSVKPTRTPARTRG